MIEYAPSRTGGALGSFGPGLSGGGAGLPGIGRTTTSDAGEPGDSAALLAFDWAVAELDSFAFAGALLLFIQPLAKQARHIRDKRITLLILFISS